MLTKIETHNAGSSTVPLMMMMHSSIRNASLCLPSKFVVSVTVKTCNAQTHTTKTLFHTFPGRATTPLQPPLSSIGVLTYCAMSEY